jgi:phosphate/sulfate permease
VEREARTGTAINLPIDTSGGVTGGTLIVALIAYFTKGDQDLQALLTLFAPLAAAIIRYGFTRLDQWLQMRAETRAQRQNQRQLRESEAAIERRIRHVLQMLETIAGRRDLSNKISDEARTLREELTLAHATWHTQRAVSALTPSPKT